MLTDEALLADPSRYIHSETDPETGITRVEVRLGHLAEEKRWTTPPVFRVEVNSEGLVSTSGEGFVPGYAEDPAAWEKDHSIPRPLYGGNTEDKFAPCLSGAHATFFEVARTASGVMPKLLNGRPSPVEVEHVKAGLLAPRDPFRRSTNEQANRRVVREALVGQHAKDLWASVREKVAPHLNKEVVELLADLPLTPERAGKLYNDLVRQPELRQLVSEAPVSAWLLNDENKSLIRPGMRLKDSLGVLMASTQEKEGATQGQAQPVLPLTSGFIAWARRANFKEEKTLPGGGQVPWRGEIPYNDVHAPQKLAKALAAIGPKLTVDHVDNLVVSPGSWANFHTLALLVDGEVAAAYAANVDDGNKVLGSVRPGWRAVQLIGNRAHREALPRRMRLAKQHSPEIFNGCRTLRAAANAYPKVLLDAREKDWHLNIPRGSRKPLPEPVVKEMNVAGYQLSAISNIEELMREGYILDNELEQLRHDELSEFQDGRAFAYSGRDAEDEGRRAFSVVLDENQTVSGIYGFEGRPMDHKMTEELTAEIQGQIDAAQHAMRVENAASPTVAQRPPRRTVAR